MIVQGYEDDFLYYSLIPRHNVPLDPSSCSTPPPVFPTEPPPPPSFPPGTPDICNTLSDIVNNTVAPLTCFTWLPCNSLVCDLISGGNLYDVNVRFLPQENAVKAYMTLSAPWTASYRLEVKEGTTMQNYSIEPEGSLLRFVFTAEKESLTLEVRYCV